MDEIQATFKVTTPMFLSGANRNVAELRLPSIKSAIRFWWRALAWKWCKEKLQDVRKDDLYLFGSTERQSSVWMKLGDVKMSSINVNLRSLRGAVYMGYGIKNIQGTLSREQYISPQTTFQVRFKFRKDLGKQREPLLCAIKLFGLLGGMGSRSRKGYGSITLQDLTLDGEKWTQPTNYKSFKEQIHTLLPSPLPAKKPEYTAFSAKSAICVVEEGNDPMALLDRVGSTIQTYRSFRSPTPNFVNDHHWMLDAVHGRPVTNHPERVAFGLPHNYFFQSVAKATSPRDAKVDVSGSKSERRSSPLFIHIHEYKDGQYAAICTLLPAVFLPPTEKIRIKASARSGGTYSIPQSVNYDIIRTLLDSKYFPKIQKVLS